MADYHALLGVRFHIGKKKASFNATGKTILQTSFGGFSTPSALTARNSTMTAKDTRRNTPAADTCSVAVTGSYGSISETGATAAPVFVP